MNKEQFISAVIEGTIPFKKENDAGFDLFALEDTNIPKHNITVIKTGTHLAIPQNYFGLVTGRSGITSKKKIIVCPGIIDCGYTGDIGIMAYNTTGEDYLVKKGDKFAQLIIIPFLNIPLKQVDKLEETERGNKGFGSSGM